jgi:hypothetical protein
MYLLVISVLKTITQNRKALSSDKDEYINALANITLDMALYDNSRNY